VKRLPKIEIDNPWLNDLSTQGREQVEREITKQRRAEASMLNGTMPNRTARRIIPRSQRRVNYIIADELVKGRAKA
jgi:hypothetical protein